MIIRKCGWLLVILMLVSLSTCIRSEHTLTQEADLVLRNGKIAVVNDLFSIREAVAVRGDEIIFVGYNDEVEKFIGNNTRVIELDGRLVTPGFIDSHGHMKNLGAELTSLKINDTTSFAQIVDRVAERVKTTPSGEWIIGGRWDQNDWDEKVFPVHDALSAVSPDNPVFLHRIDGNSGFANQKAMEMAGITKDSPEPMGGQIIRKENGEPTGVLINRAMNPVKDLFPKITNELYQEYLLTAIDHCAALGITGWHEAGIGPWELDIYKKLVDQGKMKIRAYAMLGEQEVPVLEGDLVEHFSKHKLENYGGNYFLEVNSIKLFFDGALGSRGAAFFEPYTDDPENIGVLRIEPDYIYRVTQAALKVGMGVNTHCIGVRGNRLCLDAYEKALLENPTKDHRLRIEHAQIVRDEDIAKFVELGVIPAMQPTHCTSDMTMVPSRVGPERSKGAYAWRKFLDSGCIIPAGSDFPVEQANPLFGVYSAVTRQDHAGEPEGGWMPDQKMTIEEAIKGFTIWAAYAGFQEDVLGSIEVGKLADFVVWDKDILTIEPKEILTTRALTTIVGGKVIFEQS
ncbi:MAG: amidohydrolase [Planctomycetes bacterium]|nr:amidohydrolase [Planctomycetota bacterium]